MGSTMPTEAPLATPQGRRDIAGFRAAIVDVPVIDDARVVRRRSRDFFWYSPILDAELGDKTADLLVSPRDEADVLRVAAAAARCRMPITPRGAGTGNYGQAVPLAGGALLDLTGLAAIGAPEGAQLSVEPGATMGAIDTALRPHGFELRMHPSTKRVATIGGFVEAGRAVSAPSPMADCANRETLSAPAL